MSILVETNVSNVYLHLIITVILLVIALMGALYYGIIQPPEARPRLNIFWRVTVGVTLLSVLIVSASQVHIDNKIKNNAKMILSQHPDFSNVWVKEDKVFLSRNNVSYSCEELVVVENHDFEGKEYSGVLFKCEPLVKPRLLVPSVKKETTVQNA